MHAARADGDMVTHPHLVRVWVFEEVFYHQCSL